ncbi:hypothetical protein [Dyella sp.]|uniref:hypothetical protein n=1 Tax=Dyella sp. TaxID=1869338 RepID=UPI002ECFB129
MGHNPAKDAAAELLEVARSFAELTHRAMSDNEIALAGADMMAFAARQATCKLEEFINSLTQGANAFAFTHTQASASLDKAYNDFECLADAAQMIRMHGVGSQYTNQLTYLMRYAADSACEHLDRAERALLSNLPLGQVTRLHAVERT